jgi:hypothetical protein
MKTALMLFSLILFAQASAAFDVDRSICGHNAYISYHANGRLKYCSNLDRTYFQESLACNVSSDISFFDNGKVNECTVSGTYTFGNITCLHSGLIRFYSSGSLMSCTLLAPTKISGRLCRGSHPFNLFEDGRLDSCFELNF